MAILARTFPNVKELQEYIADQAIPRGQILSVGQSNKSGHYELVYDDATLAYVAGSGAGTETVPAGAALYEVSVSAVGGATTITIGGGDSIALASGDTFTEDFGGRVIGELDIVLGANAQYFISWMV